MQIFKCGFNIEGINKEELLADFLNNNYAIYGFTQADTFDNNMKRGDLLVLNKGHSLLYIGQVTFPPSSFDGFKNLSNIPALDSFTSLDKWVNIHVKKFYDIAFFNKEHTTQASGTKINQKPLVKELKEIFDYVSKI
ncbi:MAG: hypothetical protein LBQ34_05550 [Alphaproteobacteria bacterium]|jgi:hypothetical protein|nr:hypothetical protein [Alphaproteobacteria bacterium]